LSEGIISISEFKELIKKGGENLLIMLLLGKKLNEFILKEVKND